MERELFASFTTDDIIADESLDKQRLPQVGIVTIIYGCLYSLTLSYPKILKGKLRPYLLVP